MLFVFPALPAEKDISFVINEALVARFGICELLRNFNKVIKFCEGESTLILSS